MRLQLVPRRGAPDLRDLPWSTPLEGWQSPRLVEPARGIGRHVVRFVDYGGAYFALKELTPHVAEREFRLLRFLSGRGLPAIEPLGVVSDRGAELPSVLVTRFLEFSLPARLAIARRPLPDVLDRMVEALAELLVRLHLAGFYWGDCSLSNALFRRDAGMLAAYLVDAETSERHPELSPGQRAHDLELAEEHVFGELLDLGQAGGDSGRDPLALATEVTERYARLWDELTGEEEFGLDERTRLDERLERLNELGFDVDEVELLMSDAGYRLRLRPGLVEPGHHRRRLLRLTGLDAQENQARRLLADVAAYRSALDRRGHRHVSDAQAAGRWLADVFEAAIASVPSELRAKRDPAQLFHELLDHRWYLSERAGREVGLDEAVGSYVESVLSEAADERVTLADGGWTASETTWGSRSEPVDPGNEPSPPGGAESVDT